METHKGKIGLIMSILFGVMFCGNIFATTKTWTGLESINWSNPNNWDPTGIPDVGDDVLFDWNALNDCTLDITTSIQNFTIDNFDYLLTIPSDYNIYITGDISIGIRLQTWINTSTIVLNGSGNQTIEIDNPELWVFENLTIDKPSTDTLFLKSHVSVNNTLTNCHGTIIVSDPIGADYCISYGALPIELLSFTVVADHTRINISWSTASEINNNYFIIEKSSDCINWIELTRIDGQGNSSVIVDYSVIDDNPFIGTSYYRLTQVDYDGESETFPIRSISFFSEISDVKIYPNPAKDDITISCDDSEINIFNQLGILISTGIPGKNDISKLNKGMYYVVINNKTYSFIKL